MSGYRPCDPEIIQDRMSTLNQAYEELCALAESRRKRLEESRTLWQFYWDMADEEGWIREKEQLMSSPDLGHDLTSVNLLLSKHKVRVALFGLIFVGSEEQVDTERPRKMDMKRKIQPTNKLNGTSFK